jgi:hypothetical protein
MLQLEMAKHNSDTSKTIAECIFWFWNSREIVILKVWAEGCGIICFRY